jgi:hypothetical protein
LWHLESGKSKHGLILLAEVRTSDYPEISLILQRPVNCCLHMLINCSLPANHSTPSRRSFLARLNKSLMISMRRRTVLRTCHTARSHIQAQRTTAPEFHDIRFVVRRSPEYVTFGQPYQVTSCCHMDQLTLRYYFVNPTVELSPF